MNKMSGFVKATDDFHKATLIMDFENRHRGYFDYPSNGRAEWVKPEHVSKVMESLSNASKVIILENFEIDEEKNIIKRKAIKSSGGVS